jgi:hypothetical protein
MARKSVGKGKVKEKTMVVCPKCGGSEFEMDYIGTRVASNVHPVATRGEETLYEYEVVALGSHYFAEPVFTCTACETELVL